jgi:glycosyltransferase involved in cell wall biosynthesis
MEELLEDIHEYAILIPAFNEELSIAAVIQAASNYGKAIVIDDGSSDPTSEIAYKLGALVIRHEKNYGYQAALNSGLCEAIKLKFKYF